MSAMCANLQNNKLLATLFQSVRPSALNNSAPTGKILVKFCVQDFLCNLPRKFKSVKFGSKEKAQVRPP